MKNITCCFTGHREIPAGKYAEIKKRLEKEIEILIHQDVIYFTDGGALGFDTLAALTVLEFRKQYPQIKLIMVLPCKEQDKMWSDSDKRIYASILERADKIIYTSEYYHRGCMHIRNRYLADCSGHCIAYLEKPTGGTAYTVNYIQKKGIKVINVAED